MRCEHCESTDHPCLSGVGVTCNTYCTRCDAHHQSTQGTPSMCTACEKKMACPDCGYAYGRTPDGGCYYCRQQHKPLPWTQR